MKDYKDLMEEMKNGKKEKLIKESKGFKQSLFNSIVKEFNSSHNDDKNEIFESYLSAIFKIESYMSDVRMSDKQKVAKFNDIFKKEIN